MPPSSLRRRIRASRHQCAGCRSRRALFQYRGEVRADRDHNLCLQCFRSEVDRLRANRLQIAPQPLRMTLPAHPAGLPSVFSYSTEPSCAFTTRKETEGRPDRSFCAANGLTSLPMGATIRASLSSRASPSSREPILGAGLRASERALRERSTVRGTACNGPVRRSTRIALS
jgi:hypothetical protein